MATGRTRKLDIEITDSRRGHGFRDASRDVDDFDRRIKAGSSSWGRSLSGFGNVATAALGGLAVGFAAAGVAGMSLIKAAEDSQKVTRQTKAVLESMGNVAGVTAEEVAELSEQLSLKTGIDDELIQSGQNVLLTFGRVRDEVGKGNDIFTRATTAALDMSVALGTDMQSAVTQVGKALNDPITGLSTLTRVGVQFTDQQKEMIAMLVAGGDTLGAQKVILEELETQFSGSAEAQATATDKLSVAFGNVQEALGEKLLPYFEDFSDWVIEKGIPKVTELWQGFEEDLLPKLVEAWQIVRGDVMPALRGLGDSFVYAKDQLVPLLEGLGSLFGALTGTSDETDDLSNGIRFLGVIFKASIAGPTLFWRILGKVWEVMGAVYGIIGDVIQKVREFFGLLASIPGRIRDAFQNRLGGLGGGLGGIVGGVAGALGGLFGAQGGIVTPTAIERFAGGGIAGYGRDTVPAMLATREMVLTERDQRNLLGMISSGRGGGTTIVNVSMAGAIVAANDRQFEDLVVRTWNKAVRTGAGVNTP